MRRRWLLAAAALALIGGSFLYAVRSPSSEEAAWRPTQTAAPVALNEALPGPGNAATAAAQQVTPTEPRGVDEVELCGGVWLKLDPNGWPDEAALSSLTQEPKARARILDRMQSSPSELARIAALVLSNLGDDEKRLAMLALAPSCEGAECPVSESAKDEARRSLDAVARVALSTRDPKVYAFAFGWCAGRVEATAGACRMLSAEQWSRLDPGNAMPWLHMLGTAAALGDEAARDEALFRIANAVRNDADLFATAGAVLDAAPDGDATMLASWGLVTQVIGAAAARTLPPYQALMTMCKGDALKDANRLQTCAAVAETLAERSDALIARMIGVAIGKELGWPAARRDRMRGEHESYLGSLSMDTTDMLGLGCAKMRRNFAMLRRSAAVGETGVLREWVAKSGKTADEFIREQRARERHREAAAAKYQREEAASAAAASAAAVQR